MWLDARLAPGWRSLRLVAVYALGVVFGWISCIMWAYFLYATKPGSDEGTVHFAAWQGWLIIIAMVVGSAVVAAAIVRPIKDEMASRQKQHNLWQSHRR